MRYRVAVAYKVSTDVFVEANSKKEAREKAKKLGFDELTAGVYEGGWARIYGNVGAYEVEEEEEEKNEQRQPMGDWDIELDRSILGKYELSTVQSACHEVAHGVVSELLHLTVRWLKVYDEDDRRSGGECLPMSRQILPSHLEPSIIVNLAGVAFNKLISKGTWNTGNEVIDDGGLTDMQEAERLAKLRLECFPGVEPVDEQIACLLSIARDMVVKNWNFITRVGRDLALVGRITGKEFRKLMVEQDVSYQGSHGAGGVEIRPVSASRHGKKQGSAAVSV